ncbi:hypothetical protein B0H10DRAFT_2428255, partial [Mycena sp. CBHHK59/15]
MEAPGLKTRAINKTVHPAVNAGLKKQVRRTPAQIAQARDDETTAKAQAALDKKKELKRLAALEDEQHRDDLAYTATANHPADKPVKAHNPSISHSGAKVQPSGAESGADDKSDGYQQPEEEGEESDDDDDTDAEDSDADEAMKKKNKKSTTRADVLASRTTQDSTGTPAIGDAANQKKRKAQDKPATGASKKAKKNTPKKKSGLDDRVSTSKAKGAVSDPEDDSMVAPGGPALDDDVDEHVERPKTGKQKKGKPAA